MLTPAQLDRTSAAYRRGYREGLEDKPFEPESREGTFAFTDYRDGYLAGRDEMHWTRKHRAAAKKKMLSNQEAWDEMKKAWAGKWNPA